MFIFVVRDYARLDLTTIAEWTSVLKLSTAWDFESIRELAIVRLLPLLCEHPLEMLITARLYHVDEWVDAVIYDMAERDETLDDSEADRLDLADLMCIMKLREAWAASRVVAALRMDPHFARRGR